MPKVRANLADVTTEIILPDPARYVFQLIDIKENTERQKAPSSGQEVERTHYIFKSKIVRDTDGGADYAGRQVTEYIHIHTKEGELNEIGLASIKRYFEAIAPESANSEDADTDELLNGFFEADLIHTSDQKGKGPFANIKNTTITAVE